MRSDLKLLSEAVRKKRSERSLRKAAQSAAVSHSTLSRIENGKTPSVSTYIKLSRWVKE